MRRSRTELEEQQWIRGLERGPGERKRQNMLAKDWLGCSVVKGPLRYGFKAPLRVSRVSKVINLSSVTAPTTNILQKIEKVSKFP